MSQQSQRLVVKPIKCEIDSTLFGLTTPLHSCKRCNRFICGKCQTDSKIIMIRQLPISSKHKPCIICNQELISQKILRDTQKLKLGSDSLMGQKWIQSSTKSSYEEILNSFLAAVNQSSGEVEAQMEQFNKIYEQEKKNINFSWQDMVYHCGDQNEEFLKERVYKIIQAFLSTHQVYGFSQYMIQIAIFLLCHCSEENAFHLFTLIYEVLPKSLFPFEIQNKDNAQYVEELDQLVSIMRQTPNTSEEEINIQKEFLEINYLSLSQSFLASQLSWESFTIIVENLLKDRNVIYHIIQEFLKFNVIQSLTVRMCKMTQKLIVEKYSLDLVNDAMIKSTSPIIVRGQILSLTQQITVENQSPTKQESIIIEEQTTQVFEIVAQQALVTETKQSLSLEQENDSLKQRLLVAEVQIETVKQQNEKQNIDLEKLKEEKDLLVSTREEIDLLISQNQMLEAYNEKSLQNENYLKNENKELHAQIVIFKAEKEQQMDMNGDTDNETMIELWGYKLSSKENNEKYIEILFKYQQLEKQLKIQNEMHELRSEEQAEFKQNNKSLIDINLNQTNEIQDLSQSLNSLKQSLQEQTLINQQLEERNTNIQADARSQSSQVDLLKKEIKRIEQSWIENSEFSNDFQQTLSRELQRNDELQQQNAQLQRSIEEQNIIKDKLDANHQNVKVENEQFLIQIAEQESEIKKSKQLNNRVSELEAFNDALEIEKLELNRQLIESLNNSKKQIEETIQSMNINYEELKIELNEQMKRRQENQDQINGKNNEKETINELNNQNAELQLRIISLDDDIHKQHEQLKEKDHQLRQQLQNHRQQIQEHQQQNERHRNDNFALMQVLSEQQNMNKEQKHEVEDIQTQMKLLQQTITDKPEALQQLIDKQNQQRELRTQIFVLTEENSKLRHLNEEYIIQEQIIEGRNQQLDERVSELLSQSDPQLREQTKKLQEMNDKLIQKLNSLNMDIVEQIQFIQNYKPDPQEQQLLSQLISQVNPNGSLLNLHIFRILFSLDMEPAQRLRSASSALAIEQSPQQLNQKQGGGGCFIF